MRFARPLMGKADSILVTGGAGFIGSAIVHALNERGVEDIVVSDLLGGDDKFKNLVPLRIADYIEADDLIETAETEPNFLKRFHTVFHLGACSSTTETDASYLIRNNFEFTKRLAGASLAAGCRFIYASSAATYGDGSAGMDDRTTELHRFRPLNMYGYSKHLFDLFAAKQGWLDQIVGLKYFNVFGPNENHKGDMRSLVAKAVGQIEATGELKLFKSEREDYADGEQMRDFLYVKDAVAMTLHLAEQKEAAGLFNLGSGAACTWNRLAAAIFAAMGREPKIRYIDLPEELRDKYQYYTCADIGKLRESGYDTPLTTVEDAVSDYVRNYLLTGRRLGETGEDHAA